MVDATIDELREYCQTHPDEFEGSLGTICSIDIGTIILTRGPNEVHGWRRYKVASIKHDQRGSFNLWLDYLHGIQGEPVQYDYGYFKLKDLHKNIIEGMSKLENKDKPIMSRGMGGLGI